MTLAAPPRLISIDEFESMPDTMDYELVEGELHERKPMGALSDYVAGQLIFAIVGFCRRTDAGYVFPPSTTYRCFGHPRTGRRPDVSFVAKGRFPEDQIPEGYIYIPADVAIEVVSPNDLAYDVEAKTRLYLGHGFGELWVAYPNTQIVYVHRPDESVLVYERADTLVGRGPLEGFSCPVSELFPPAHRP